MVGIKAGPHGRVVIATGPGGNIGITAGMKKPQE
jgi:hypothetical protein